MRPASSATAAPPVDGHERRARGRPARTDRQGVTSGAASASSRLAKSMIAAGTR